MKNSPWFKHDCDAKDDLKLLKIKRIHTHWGIGIYWEVIETLRGQSDYKYSIKESDLQFLCEDLLRCKDFSRFKTWFYDCCNMQPEPLFIKDEKYFWSESLVERMKGWEIYKSNGSKGGRPQKPEQKPRRKPKQKPESDPEPDPLEGNIREYINNDFNQIFNDWLDYKKSRKETYKSEKSIAASYRRLISLSNNNPEIARLVVEQSMSNNWAGMFELKDKIKPQPYSKKKFRVKHPNGESKTYECETFEEAKKLYQQNTGILDIDEIIQL